MNSRANRGAILEHLPPSSAPGVDDKLAGRTGEIAGRSLPTTSQSAFSHRAGRGTGQRTSLDSGCADGAPSEIIEMDADFSMTPPISGA